MLQSLMMISWEVDIFIIYIPIKQIEQKYTGHSLIWAVILILLIERHLRGILCSEGKL